MKNATAFSFKEEQQMEGFAARLAQIIAEYGSRYALAQASGIPVTTLQKYTLGSKPGMDALVTLGRVANVNLHWLLTGQGQMRGAGQLPGAALADVVMVDQYDPKSSLAMPVLVNQFPLSRNYLERNLHLSDPSPQSLLAIESVWSLFEVSRGDLLLIDRTQAGLTCDGVYLLDLPGFSLRRLQPAAGHAQNHRTSPQARRNLHSTGSRFRTERLLQLSSGSSRIAG